MEEMKILSESIKELDVQVKDIGEEIDRIMFTIPNISNETVTPEDIDNDYIENRKQEKLQLTGLHSIKV